MGDFKVGDRVRIKSWNRMAKEYTEECNGITLPSSRFDIAMKPLCGLMATISRIDDERVYLKNWSDGNDHGWYFTTYMIEKGYTIVDSKWFESPTTLSFDFKIDDKDWEEWFKAPTLFINRDEDSLDAWRYALADFKTIDKYIKNEEENEMAKNEVLELWFRRKGNNIEEKYDELESKYIDEKYSVVKSYEDMIKDFERQLEELYKYSNTSEQFALVEINDCNDFKYAIDEDKLVEEAKQFYREAKKKEMDNVLKEYSEINALLSMSEDLEYQQSILIEYGIIDKKTKRMI